jgi:hypothetical protein
VAVELQVGRVRSVVLIILFSVLTAGLYYFYWLYRVNLDVRGYLREGVGATLRLVLFLLLPVVGWFIAIWMTASSVQRVQTQVGASRPVQPLYPALWAALLPVFGWFVAAGYVQGGANRAWEQAAKVLGTPMVPQRLQCPDCSSLFDAILNPVVAHSVQCPSCNRAGVV